MTYFKAPTVTPHDNLEHITRAYRAAGVPLPDAAAEIRAAIAAEPGAEHVARALATAAHEADDAAAFMADALDKIARARAADELRAAFVVVEPAVRRAQLPAILERAAVDLAPAFAAHIKALEGVSAELDRAAPLSVDAAVRDDTTKALKTAQAILAALGVFAGLYPNKNAVDAPAALSRVLPVVELPPCVIEARVASFATEPEVVNADECAGTYVVRDLARALERDTDAALIAVARGDFPGVRFALPEGVRDLRIRRSNATRSHRRRSADSIEARRMAVRA